MHRGWIRNTQARLASDILKVHLPVQRLMPAYLLNGYIPCRDQNVTQPAPQFYHPL